MEIILLAVCKSKKKHEKLVMLKILIKVKSMFYVEKQM